MEAASASGAANSELEEVVRRMEEDQEELTSNLMALTSHYAKAEFQRMLRI